VSLSVDGASLLAFVAKSDPLPTQAVTVRPTRLLVYAGGRLVAVSELAPAALPA
jgi:hypothetical protein